MLSIDRFEGGFAVCIDDDGNASDIDIKLLPENAAEGDMIYFKEGRYHISEEQTRKMREEIEALEDELFQ
ncbi:MAG: DUF3006 domain-containing protein [Oscillospiraceae bacterium]